MGVCLLRNIELASHHLPLLFQIAHLDEIDVRVAALSMVYDLLMRFGLQGLNLSSRFGFLSFCDCVMFQNQKI